MAEAKANTQRIYCIPANIPQELKRLNQWVVWGVNNNKPKIPYNPATMTPAKAGDASTWSNYFEAKNRVTCGQAKGVGFQFHNNSIYGVDLDKVFIDGELTPEAQEIVAALNSYTEISPSGTGVHIFVKAGNVELKANRKGFIEIYNKERYFTVTGNVYGVIKPIESRTDELQAVYDKYLKSPQAKPQKPAYAQDASPQYQDDNEYLNIVLQKDQVFINLWNGGRPNGNESADDQALLNKLAFWCNANESLIQSAFLRSPHYSGKDEEHIKKCNRADYIPRTVKRAINGLKTTARENNNQFKIRRTTVSPGV